MSEMKDRSTKMETKLNLLATSYLSVSLSDTNICKEFSQIFFIEKKDLHASTLIQSYVLSYICVTFVLYAENV
jgi:hypothetical protein